MKERKDGLLWRENDDVKKDVRNGKDCADRKIRVGEESEGLVWEGVGG